VVASADVPGRDARKPEGPVAPIIGTERLGRRFTDAERAHFEKVLRDHDFKIARRYALLFARRKTRSNAAAQDLVSRALVRLVRFGWDPNEVPLAHRLCRLVWSEYTHEIEEDLRRRRAEEGFLREMEAHGAATAKSVEDLATRLDEEEEVEARARTQIERLRQTFLAAKDQVNLLWLEYTLAGETDMREMARKSGRDVSEFYAATKRRARLVDRLVAEDARLKQDGKGSA
jgi:hypothetical protein